MPMDYVGIALALISASSAALFWSHCARPTLVARQASQSAHRIVLSTTIAMIAAATFGLVTDAANIDLAAWVYGVLVVIWASWVLIVGLGWFHGYQLLIRVTGQPPGSPPSSADSAQLGR